jgi:hypothetical protein
MTLKKTAALIACTLVVAVVGTAYAQGVLFVKGGFVGIGNDEPEHLLHIKRTASGLVDMVKLENNGGPQFLYFDTAINTGWREGPNPSGAFVINETSNVQVAEMRITKAGELFVAGTKLNVPDYVFEEGYPLMTLDELAAFIEENGHLPGVMTAADKERDGGINIAKLPIQLLEKVEELTLYTLEQQETIESLMAQNAQLQQRLETLESKMGN